MLHIKKNALSLCHSILGAGTRTWNFEENCLELKEALHQLANEGRYGDIRAVMNDFEERCKYHRLGEQQMEFVASLIPLTIDSAGYMLHPESDDVATAVVRNVIHYQSFTCDEGGEHRLDSLIEDFLNAGFYSQACELLDALQETYSDEPDAFMAIVMTTINLAFGDGHSEIIDWVKRNEHEISKAFRLSLNDHAHMSVGIELYEAGVEILGQTIIKAKFAPSGLDFIYAENLIGLVPNASSCIPDDQDAYVTYMLSKESLSEEWLNTPLKLSFLVKEARESLSNLLNSFNSDGRVAHPNSLNTVLAAMIRQAKDYSELDSIMLELNKVGGDVYSKVVIKAIEDIIPTILDSKPTAMGAPAILYLDLMMNRLDKVDFSAHSSLIGAKINEWAPNMNLKDFAGYAERIDKFSFDRKAMGASIEAKWPSATGAMRELLKDVTPKSVALTSRALKGSVIERELGL